MELLQLGFYVLSHPFTRTHILICTLMVGIDIIPDLVWPWTLLPLTFHEVLYLASGSFLKHMQ